MENFTTYFILNKILQMKILKVKLEAYFYYCTGHRASVTSRISQFTIPKYPFINNHEEKDEQLDGLHADCPGWDSNSGQQIGSKGY